jgi:hypothetical protein
MPEWMATGILALLLGLAGLFAVHYTMLTLDLSCDPCRHGSSCLAAGWDLGKLTPQGFEIAAQRTNCATVMTTRLEEYRFR